MKSCKGSVYGQGLSKISKGQGSAKKPNGQDPSKVLVPNSKTNGKKRYFKHFESDDDEKDVDYQASSNSQSDDCAEDGDEEQSSSEVLKGLLVQFLQRDSKKRKSKHVDTGSMKIRKVLLCLILLFCVFVDL